ncbi:MAG: cyclopropane-fatty-acyl-phospholipid synthase [Alphaproteobacteria bacterium]|nr:cyclopropane-fatty-acyl-phospholipid synthase [Alphaproteobacteria bacterium]
MLLQRVLKAMIRKGTLRMTTAGGKTFTFGDGGLPRAGIRLHNRILEWTMALYPQLKAGEAYMDGQLTMEDGTLQDFLALVMINHAHLESQPLYRWIDRLLCRSRRLKQFNPLRLARRNVAYHYDLSPKLYDLFLDSDRQYSCGYFRHPLVGLEEAQLDKKRHIAAKLLLNKAALKVLDIGSGWGGMGLYLAQEAKCDVTGVTLSEEQQKLSAQRARIAGLSGSCRFFLRDYRQETGPFDRIVSVGMFEHVGKKNYGEFFAKARGLLKDDGVCLLHSIGVFGEGRAINPFIRKHIFPGADLPSLSEVLQSVERVGLFTTDIEILRVHYADTLKLWNRRFQARRAEAAKIYDERFCRKWEFYLIGCEMAFRYGDLMVFQIQLTKQLDTLPLTRDYMFEGEQRLEGFPSLEVPAAARPKTAAVA